MEQFAQTPPFPPEVQAALKSAEAKRALAQALMAKSLAPREPGRLVGRFYVPNPPPFGELLAAYLTGREADAAEERYREAVQRLSQDRAKLLGRVMAGEVDAETLGSLDPVVVKAVQAQQDYQRGIMKDLASRIPLGQVPQLLRGDVAGLTAKPEVKVVEGSLVRVDPEGRTPPQTIGGEWEVHEVADPASGKRVLVRANRLTGRVEAIAPFSVSATASVGKEDPHLKALELDLGKQDAELFAAGKDAITGIRMIHRVRNLYKDYEGRFTGGPVAPYERFVRDLAAQFNVPISPKMDLANAKIQAEVAGEIARRLLSSAGARLSENDRVALERSIGKDLTPAQFMAFLNQLELRLAATAEDARTRLKALQGLYPQNQLLRTYNFNLPPGPPAPTDQELLERPSRLSPAERTKLQELEDRYLRR